MKNILDEIVANKRVEIEETGLRARFIDAKPLPQLNRFFKAVSHPVQGEIGLIAEIKLASPSGGVLGSETEVVDRAVVYEKSFADAISIVTDQSFFNGRPEFVPLVKKHVKLPVLRKDFVIDESQIYETAHYQADAMLLIARIVDADVLAGFVELALELGIEPVVEIYDEADLENALQTNTRIMAVNARNLQDFSINIEAACELGSKIPKDKMFIGFSGVETRHDVQQYQRAGAKAVLVGTSVMKSNDPAWQIQSLKGLTQTDEKTT